LNLSNLDTIQIKSDDALFFQTGLHGIIKDSLLYITSSLQKSAGIYNLNTKSMVLTRTQESYTELADKNFLRSRFPRLEGDYFYTTFETSRVVNIAKFNRYTLDLVQFTEIEVPDKANSYLHEYHFAICGRFIAIWSKNEIVFVDFRTGKTAGKVRY
jgi:hypothetical protein